MNCLLPDIDQFLEDPYFLGHIGQTIYPFWREKLRQVHPSPYYSPYGEIAISGSTGGGKTTFCLVSIYMNYVVSCIGNFRIKFLDSLKDSQYILVFAMPHLLLSNDVQLKNFLA